MSGENRGENGERNKNGGYGDGGGRRKKGILHTCLLPPSHPHFLLPIFPLFERSIWRRDDPVA